jgi:hypothetical protein
MNWRNRVKAEIERNVQRYAVHKPNRWGCVRPPFPLEAFMPQANRFKNIPVKCLTVLMPCHDSRMLRPALQSLDHPAIAEILIHPDGLDQARLQELVDGIPLKGKPKRTVIEHIPELSAVDLRDGGMVGNIARVRDELFKRSQTEYVMCFDSDDLLITPILDYALTALEEEQSLEVVFWHKTRLRYQHHWPRPDWCEFGNPVTTRLDAYLSFRLFQTSCAVWRRDFLEAIQNHFAELHWVDYAPVEYGVLIRAFKYLKEVNQNTHYPQMTVLPFYGTRHRIDWSDVNSGSFKDKEQQLGLIKITDEAVDLFPDAFQMCAELDEMIAKDSQTKASARRITKEELTIHFPDSEDA